MTAPLEGIRVLDWTLYQQGPVSTVLLGDLGAEVIKVEVFKAYPEFMVESFQPRGQGVYAGKAAGVRPGLSPAQAGKAPGCGAMVVFLASARAGHITGQTISVDGGYTMM